MTRPSCATVIAAAMLQLPAAEASPPVADHSPLSWSAIDQRKATVFAPTRNDLGQEDKPTAVQLVELTDERPYGAAKTCAAWLLRFDGVRLITAQNDTVAVPLTLAYAARTQELLCGFTDPSSEWVPSPLTSDQIESEGTERHLLAPASYDSLQSTVSEVLQAVLSTIGIAPAIGGQLIVRPRKVGGTNHWIAEVCGRHIMTRFPPLPACGEHETTADRGVVLTVGVGYYRDGDLKFLGGPVMQ